MSSVMFQSTVDDIRERVLTMWPDGVLYQTYRNETNEFDAQFSGTPWTSKGNLGLMYVLTYSFRRNGAHYSSFAYTYQCHEADS